MDTMDWTSAIKTAAGGFAGFWHIDAAVDISGTHENNLAEIFRCQKIDSVQS
ncbi:hypothetical protein [Syntrophus sp. (in: bacteria)]|uniref:hypothetical protein n=1 Tax=Syntrophus sp. (in: bacteria) TaxID=48412 RepID=UPI00345E55B5